MRLQMLDSLMLLDGVKRKKGRTINAEIALVSHLFGDSLFFHILSHHTSYIAWHRVNTFMHPYNHIQCHAHPLPTPWQRSHNSYKPHHAKTASRGK